MCLYCVVWGGKPHSINISSGTASCGPQILKFCEVFFRFWTNFSNNQINLTEYKLIIAPKLPMTSLGFGRHSNTWSVIRQVMRYQALLFVTISTAFLFRHIMNQVGMFFYAGHNLHGCYHCSFLTQQTCILQEGSQVCSPLSKAAQQIGALGSCSPCSRDESSCAASLLSLSCDALGMGTT